MKCSVQKVKGTFNLEQRRLMSGEETRQNPVGGRGCVNGLFVILSPWCSAKTGAWCSRHGVVLDVRVCLWMVGLPQRGLNQGQTNSVLFLLIPVKKPTDSLPPPVSTQSPFIFLLSTLVTEPVVVFGCVRRD